MTLPAFDVGIDRGVFGRCGPSAPRGRVPGRNRQHGACAGDGVGLLFDRQVGAVHLTWDVGLVQRRPDGDSAAGVYPLSVNASGTCGMLDDQDLYIMVAQTSGIESFEPYTLDNELTHSDDVHEEWGDASRHVGIPSPTDSTSAIRRRLWSGSMVFPRGTTPNSRTL
jgi:hypothetical protein